jgi:hypothetical protein
MSTVGPVSSFGQSLVTTASNSTDSSSADSQAINQQVTASNEAGEMDSMNADLEKARDSDVRAALGAFGNS